MKRIRQTINDNRWEIVIWAGSFIVLGFVVLFALHSYRSVEREMAAQFNREQMLLAQQTAMGIEQYMSDITNVLNLTAQIKSVAEGDTDSTETAIKNAYRSLKNKVSFVFWEDASGILQHHYPNDILPGIDGKNYSFRTYFRVAKELGVPFVSDIIMVGGEQYQEIPDRFESFVISYPLKNTDGSFKGVIGCAIDLTNITAHYVAPIKPSETGYAWLVDESGLMLYHPNPKLIGMNLYDIVTKMEKQALKASGMDTIRQGMENKNDGMYEFIFPHYPRQELTKKLLAFSSVHFLNRRWITVATSPYSEVIYLMSGTFRNTMTLGAASIGFVLIATFFMFRINKARTKADERNKWADRVLVAHKRLETIFDGIPHYLVMVDSGFFITEINQQYCDLYGKERHELIGNHCTDDFSKDRSPCLTDIIERCFKSGKVISETEKRIEILGETYFFDISVIPLFGSDGKVDHVVQYVFDITEKKALTEKLIQAEKLAAVGQMSAHVAHEIRNPLASVMLNTELLEDELEEMADTSEAVELLNVIKKEIDRLSEITDEYLSYARLPHPKKQFINPEAEVSSAVAMMLPELKRRNIKALIKHRGTLTKLMIDRGQFRQVLINLIKNAADAMPSGGDLELSLMGIKENFLLLVKDTGFGIPEEIRRRIFDPYFTTKENGTGLGLALVQYIANAHDGWVDVESQKNSGSTFIFSIPLEIPSSQALER